MTTPATILRAAERETLTPDERAMFDAAVTAIPAEWGPVFTALMIGSRGMVRHHGRELVTVAEGYRELLDASDERAREFASAASDLSTATAATTQQLAAAVAIMTAIRADFDAYVAESRAASAESAADRADIHSALTAQGEALTAQGQDLAAERRHLARLTWAFAALALAVAALVAELLLRYWPLLSGALLGAVLLLLRRGL